VQVGADLRVGQAARDQGERLPLLLGDAGQLTRGRLRGIRPPGVECTDWPYATSQADLDRTLRRMRAAAPYTGAAGTLQMAMTACIGWPAPLSNPPRPLPHGLPPLLSAGAWGEYDAAARVVAQVPGSRSIYHDGPGHTLYTTNACARKLIDDYLADKLLPPAGSRC